MLSLSTKLEENLTEILEGLFPEVASKSLEKGLELNPQLKAASKPEFGDFQVNCALPLAKVVKKSPREVAQKITQSLNASDYFTKVCQKIEIAGPGFINITIEPEILIKEIQKRLQDPKRIGVPLYSEDKCSISQGPVIIDFSSPNIAKEMHVGHLRSTIIGDCLARILEFRGFSVLRLNHIGDWGTQFGMLITHLKEVAPASLKQADVLDLGDLVTFYREAKKRFDTDSQFQDLSRKEVVNLQKGDLTSLKAWGLICDQSRLEFQKIYDRLNIKITERGESFYNKYLHQVVIDLKKSNLLVVNDGAQCVFLEGMIGKEGKPLPIIIQKSDGGFNYATTDLAAIRYRLREKPEGDGAYRLIYVTDSGQASHFEGVFRVAEEAGWVQPHCQLEHVPFGLVQGEDGKKLKTRSGETVRLKDLLDEAIERAKANLIQRLKAEGRKETDDFIKIVSRAVGIAAVKYADLSQNRNTNYQFSFNRMLALQGNTAPYLLYALVRIRGIARKGGDFKQRSSNLQFNDPCEWNLIKELLKFDAVIEEVEKELLPNRLCTYLFELSQAFNRFYDKVPILKSNKLNKESRLSLCKLTADTLELGMTLLGLPTLDRM